MKSKKQNKKFLYFLFIAVFIFSAGAYLIYQYNIYSEYSGQILKLEEDIDLAIKEQDDLQNQMEYQNSNEYIEKIAREKLGMVRSNEILFIDKNK